jgi:hypothetical protein
LLAKLEKPIQVQTSMDPDGLGFLHSVLKTKVGNNPDYKKVNPRGALKKIIKVDKNIKILLNHYLNILFNGTNGSKFITQFIYSNGNVYIAIALCN